MAYLSIQKDYLLFDTQIKSNFYDKDLEYDLLKSFGLTEILIDDICDNYFSNLFIAIAGPNFHFLSTELKY